MGAGDVVSSGTPRLCLDMDMHPHPGCKRCWDLGMRGIPEAQLHVSVSSRKKHTWSWGAGFILGRTLSGLLGLGLCAG